jgi:N-acetylglutamate synthase-like GNAT family acetyltransferase
MTGVNGPVAVRPATADDIGGCVDIIRALPEFFTPDVPETVRADLSRHRGWVVTMGSQVLGFVVVALRSDAAAEIRWMAVAADSRGVGHGTTLIDHVLGELEEEGVSVVEVKTLDHSASDPTYEPTRAFWEHRGFVQIDTIDPLPGWQPGNPSAIYVAALKPTR